MAIQALERLEMASWALQLAGTLSGGQQQRVTIARALVQEPQLLLADEPIASLDLHSATRVMEALQRINREDGITVICNLHHVNTARAYCNRIIGMARGRVVFNGPPESLTLDRLRLIYGLADEEEPLEQAMLQAGSSMSEDLMTLLPPAVSPPD